MKQSPNQSGPTKQRQVNLSNSAATPSCTLSAADATRASAPTDARSAPQWGRYIDSRLKQFCLR